MSGKIVRNATGREELPAAKEEGVTEMETSIQLAAKARPGLQNQDFVKL